MEAGKWLGYNELAWLEPIIAPPEKHAEETEHYCRLIRKYLRIEAKTLLHLASGAGINDYTFKRFFMVTGVDISKGMLEVAKTMNPEVAYHHGDMRSINLKTEFDVVVIPDSIGYITTRVDLRMVIDNAYRHLKPGGILLITAHMKEEFRENNFVYTGSSGDIEVTVFENNYIIGPVNDCYEATIIYLIRHKGKLEIYSECHQLGLFKAEIWSSLFAEFKLAVNQIALNDLYNPYILNSGFYPLTVFLCNKPL